MYGKDNDKILKKDKLSNFEIIKLTINKKEKDKISKNLRSENAYRLYFSYFKPQTYIKGAVTLFDLVNKILKEQKYIYQDSNNHYKITNKAIENDILIYGREDLGYKENQILLTPNAISKIELIKKDVMKYYDLYIGK